MVESATANQSVSQMERTAVQRARDRANDARWTIDIAIFLFAVLFIIIILLVQGIAVEIGASVAIFGLAMGWFIGFRQGRQLYQSFYDEELKRLEREPKGKVERTWEEIIAEKIRDSLRERWH